MVDVHRVGATSLLRSRNQPWEARAAVRARVQGERRRCYELAIYYTSMSDSIRIREPYVAFALITRGQFVLESVSVMGTVMAIDPLITGGDLGRRRKFEE